VRTDIVGAGLCEFSHINFEIFSMGGDFVEERIQPQGSYGYGSSCILKSTSNYIFYQKADYFKGDLA
jgi:hypothetical protein